jgi:hypothetical protein
MWSQFPTKVERSGWGGFTEFSQYQVAPEMQASSYLSQRNFDNIHYIPSAADWIRAMESARFCSVAISARLENSGSRNYYSFELARLPQRIPPAHHSCDDD